MSHITEIMFSVPYGTEANCASIESVQSYCQENGDTADWHHMEFAGGNVLSNDLYIFTLRHCYLNEFLLFANSLPWHETDEARIEMFIKDEDWVVFKRFGPSMGWLLPYDSHVDEHGISREFAQG